MIRYLLLFIIFANISPVFAKEKAKTYVSEGHKFRVEILLDRDDVIWGFDFIPNDQVIFTERSGKMLIYSLKDSTVTDLSGVPQVFARGQGGLLDIRLHNLYPKVPWIFFSYAEPVGDGLATTVLARAQIKGTQLTKLEKIFTAHEPNSNDIHFG